MEIRPPVFDRRCEVLARFESSRYLPESQRLEIARRHGVGRDRIADDLMRLREAGSLELRGARGCYRWIKPYSGQKLPKPAPPKTSTRNCLCCGAEFASQGIHNRLCDPCRSAPPGMAGYRLVQ